MLFLLKNNVQITVKLFKLNFQEGRNFSNLIEACGALSLRVDHSLLREYLGAAGWWRPILQDSTIAGLASVHSQCTSFRTARFCFL